MSRSRTKKLEPAKENTFFDLLIPSYLIFCEDYILGENNSLSIIKTIDVMRAETLPYVPERLVLVATFYRHPAAALETFSSLKPELKVELVNPADARFDLGIYPVSNLDPLKPWIVERLIIPFQKGDIQFNSSGGYSFEISGRIGEQQFELTHYQLLPVTNKRVNRKLVAKT